MGGLCGLSRAPSRSTFLGHQEPKLGHRSRRIQTSLLILFVSIALRTCLLSGFLPYTSLGGDLTTYRAVQSLL